MAAEGKEDFAVWGLNKETQVITHIILRSLNLFEVYDTVACYEYGTPILLVIIKASAVPVTYHVDVPMS